MEIVTEPDFENAFDAYSFVRELALVFKSIGTCSANMSNGEFRVDVNVSLHHNNGPINNGVRVELKNLNSFSSVLKATEIEINRQKSLIKSDKLIERETRTYDSVANKTVAIRHQFAGKQTRLAKGDIDDNRIGVLGTAQWNTIQIDASIRWKHLEINTSAINILNQKYKTHGSGVYGMGRAFGVSVNWKL
jgi:Glu-tRNA(Gln) amidotransferase subunit E-like FAD-binding protein